MNRKTIEKLVRAFAPAWITRSGGPARAVVALTRRCNLRCAICHTASLEPGREMSPGEVNRLFWGMPRLAWLDLTGGEPFLRGDVTEVFDAILYQCHVWDRPLVDLRANGFRLDTAWSAPDVVDARRQAVALDCGGCFTPCEAYTTLAGSPLRAALLTAIRTGRLASLR